MNDFEGFRRAYVAASERLVNGDPGPVAALYALDDPVSAFGALGGFEHGPAVVQELIARVGAHLSHGTFTEELLLQWVGLDTAMTCSIETVDAVIANSPNRVRQRVRVTQVYRFGDDGWRIVHRHSDLHAPPPASAGPNPGK